MIRALRRAGWYFQHHHSFHAYLRHPEHPGMRITVAVHAGETIKPKTLQSILKQAGLSVADFQELL
ncbi:MAG TPA: type II toxin-antitoxin system HicA family toxin [Ktedonobacteraceae bacterium]|nr:type II toxin-antitoxin system HicA family toxin [Ktedonobacteraceae bacterium]